MKNVLNDFLSGKLSVFIDKENEHSRYLAGEYIYPYMQGVKSAMFDDIEVYLTSEIGGPYYFIDKYADDSLLLNGGALKFVKKRNMDIMTIEEFAKYMDEYAKLEQEMEEDFISLLEA